MAIYRTKQNGVAAYGIDEYMIDSNSDLELLKETTPGSKAYNPNTGEVYILTTSQNWVLEKTKTSSNIISDYSQLNNKPSINGIELNGNQTLEDLNIQEKGDYITLSFLEEKNYATKDEIPVSISELTNDTNYITLNEVKNLTDLTYYYNKTDIDGKDFAAKSDVADSISLLKTVGDAIQLGNVEKTLNINSKDDIIRVNSHDTVALLTPYPDDENRLALVLKNHDSISGTMLDGNGANLIMLSKWDVVDVGSNKIRTNLNAKDYLVTLNDDSSLLYSKEDLKEKSGKALTVDSTGAVVSRDSTPASEVKFSDGDSLQTKLNNGSLKGQDARMPEMQMSGNEVQWRISPKINSVSSSTNLQTINCNSTDILETIKIIPSKTDKTAKITTISAFIYDEEGKSLITPSYSSETAPEGAQFDFLEGLNPISATKIDLTQTTTIECLTNFGTMLQAIIDDNKESYPTAAKVKRLIVMITMNDDKSRNFKLEYNFTDEIDTEWKTLFTKEG